MRQFLVIGLFTGAIYGLLAVGLVLVYKGARVFNFAQGEFGTVAAYVVWYFHAQANAPYGLAVLAGVGGGGGLRPIVGSPGGPAPFPTPPGTPLRAPPGGAPVILG